MNRDIETGLPGKTHSQKAIKQSNTPTTDHTLVELTFSSPKNCCSSFFSFAPSSGTIVRTCHQTSGSRANKEAEAESSELAKCLSRCISAVVGGGALLTFLAIPCILSSLGAAVLQNDVAVAAKSGAAGQFVWLPSLIVASCLAKQCCVYSGVKLDHTIISRLINYSLNSLGAYIKLTILLSACTTATSLYGRILLSKTDKDSITPNELASSTILGTAIATLVYTLGVYSFKTCSLESTEESVRTNGLACS